MFKRYLAENVFINDNVQLVLSKDSMAIKLPLAKNKSINKHIMTVLSKDHNKWVRYNILTNISINEQIAKSILKDIDLAHNASYSCDNENIQLILSTHNDPVIRKNLAINKMITEKVQLILAYDINTLVRKSLASNVIISNKVKKILSKDKDPIVTKEINWVNKLCHIPIINERL